jgi:hypothetical protein
MMNSKKKCRLLMAYSCRSDTPPTLYTPAKLRCIYVDVSNVDLHIFIS